MSSIHAVVTDSAHPTHLTIQEVESPVARSEEAIVQVSAISLNRGEVNRSQNAPDGWRPGWDLAGTVIKQAADGSGPREGSRVVGFLGEGAWAQQVAVPTTNLAEIPASVSFAQAATLPVAGLTALRSLEKGGLLLKKRVLITGATGGVGHFGVQLAKLAGAYVVGTVRASHREAVVKDAGADAVIVGNDIAEAEKLGPYDLIIDGVGGKTFGSAVGMLAQGGTAVGYGASEGAETSLDLRRFFPVGGTSIYGFILFYEARVHPVSSDLARLAQMIADKQITPLIEIEKPWQEIGDVAQHLLKRSFVGKAVLHLDH
jgi:NADPH2:quinone reductase